MDDTFSSEGAADEDSAHKHLSLAPSHPPTTPHLTLTAPSAPAPSAPAADFQENSTPWSRGNRVRLHVQFVKQEEKTKYPCDVGTCRENQERLPEKHLNFQNEEPFASPSVSFTSQSSDTTTGNEGGNSNSSTTSSSGSSSSRSSSSSEDDSSSEKFTEPARPDGGWGWVVVAASFMVNLIADGITFSFGVLFVEFLHYFNEGKSYTSWIGSLFMAMPLLSGPIASFLTDRFGCRCVTIAGALMASAGFIASSFTSSLEMLFLTFGVVAGFGLSLCYVAAVVIVAYYFDSKRSLATGLSVCGSGIGTFVFAPLTQYLLLEYGWRGTVLILAGLLLNLCVCGSLMRDLEWTTRTREERAKKAKLERGARRHRRRLHHTGSSIKSVRTNGSSSETLSAGLLPNICDIEQLRKLLQTPGTAAFQLGEGNTAVNNDTASRLSSSLVSLPTFVRNKEKVPIEVMELLSTKNQIYKILLHNYPNLLSSRSFSDSGCLNDPHLQVLETHRIKSTYCSILEHPDEKQVKGKEFTLNVEDENNVDCTTELLHKCDIPPKKNGYNFETRRKEADEKYRDNTDKSVLFDSHFGFCNRDDLKVDTHSSLPFCDGLNGVVHNGTSTSEISTKILVNNNILNGCFNQSNNGPLNQLSVNSDNQDQNVRKLPTSYLRDLRVHRHSLTYRGAMLNINRYRLRASSCPDIYRNSMTTIAREKDEWYTGLWELWYVLFDMLDFSHFLDLRFSLFALSNFLLYTWYDVPYVYLMDNAIEVGYSETDASFLFSVIGIMNMIGEIGLGWMGDRPWVNPSLVYAGCMGGCGLVVALIPFLTIHSYKFLSVASGGFGLFIAANYSLTSIILVELISIERFTNAYGLLLLVQGVANLVGPPLAGWLYDVLKSYDLSFYLAGIFIAVSGLLLLVLPAIEKYRSMKQKWLLNKNPMFPSPQPIKENKFYI